MTRPWWYENRPDIPVYRRLAANYSMGFLTPFGTWDRPRECQTSAWFKDPLHSDFQIGYDGPGPVLFAQPAPKFI